MSVGAQTSVPVPKLTTRVPFVPTITPTKKTMATPCARPSKSATSTPPSNERARLLVLNIRIQFTGVAAIPATDLLQLQREMEVWFGAYFNIKANATIRRTRTLQRLHRHRVLQFGVFAVRNIKTVYNVTNQDTFMTMTTRESNTVTFTQNLEYDAVSSGAHIPDEYVLLPFTDLSHKTRLLQTLQSKMVSFANLTAMSEPVIASEEQNVERKSLSCPVRIVIIVAGSVIGLLLLVCIAYALILLYMFFVVVKKVFVKPFVRLTSWFESL
jgi:hypothetical protein